MFNPRKKFWLNFIKYLGEYVTKISPTVFIVSGLTFIIYFWLESFKTGLISNYFDLNLLLVLVIISGLIMLIFGENLAKVRPILSFLPAFKSRRAKKHYLFAAIFAILVALFLYSALADILGDLGLFTALVGGLLIFLAINLFYQKTNI